MGHIIIPVQIDREFEYPGDSFYADLKSGKILSVPGDVDFSTELSVIESLLRSLFIEISLQFDANASAQQIEFMLMAVKDRFRAFAQTGSHMSHHTRHTLQDSLSRNTVMRIHASGNPRMVRTGTSHYLGAAVDTEKPRLRMKAAL